MSETRRRTEPVSQSQRASLLQTTSPEVVDAALLSALRGLPMFQRWRNEPLAPELLAVLSRLSEQQLMTLTAAALRQLLVADARVPAA